jgi:hypothetical protein
MDEGMGDLIMSMSEIIYRSKKKYQQTMLDSEYLEMYNPNQYRE